MSRARTPRRRLALAVVTALAVTVGTLVAVPAVAAPGAATAAVRQAGQDVPFPVKGWITSSGRAGFLSYQSDVNAPLVAQWTRFADGATTVLPALYGPVHGTDFVSAGKKDGVFTLYDMAGGGEPLKVDVRPLGDGYAFAGWAGTRLLMKKANATGGTNIHVVGTSQGVLTDDTVTGLPADAVIGHVDVDAPDTAVVRYTGTMDGVKRDRAAVVDVASHTVVEQYEPSGGEAGSTDLSATHIVWVERSEGATTKLAVTRRGTTGTVRHDLGITAPVAVELIGDWVTYRQFESQGPLSPSSLYALYARSLTTGETVKLLEHTTSSVPGADGTQMAVGGTLDRGEGLYRIAPGPDGTLAATLVASTGQPTALELVRHDVPGTIDLDRVATPVPLNWTLSKRGTRAFLEMVHTATGKTWRLDLSSFPGNVVGLKWDGLYGRADDSVPAPNGDYAWRLTAKPLDGIGPALEETGAFRIARKAVPHDFNDNGTPDLLVREPTGRLSLHNTSTPLGAWALRDPEPLGTGWNAYDRLVAPGDLGGSPHADVLGRDGSGVLWLHQGTGHALAPRTRVGGGWNTYARLTGGSDLNGDGRPDLVAVDKPGDLYFYASTGSTATPFAARKKIGHGWGIYHQITATGNIGGGAAGDLIARDKDGVLWLYLGKGDGTFAPRTKIGGGWNTYADVVGIGDVDRDGRADLVGVTAGYGVPYFHKGTGDWRAPFAPRSEAYSYAFINGTVF
ncbi:FG-GAP repeat domain-containing protein [Streptomyces sp. NPDC012950]|uniref:FG-GAP repeat domain-containing protein n=1 Tax=Streptomyces sp. NPDC012950 TaxID=3364858 RepID=UPI00368DEE07